MDEAVSWHRSGGLCREGCRARPLRGSCLEQLLCELWNPRGQGRWRAPRLRPWRGPECPARATASDGVAGPGAAQGDAGAGAHHLKLGSPLSIDSHGCEEPLNFADLDDVSPGPPPPRRLSSICGCEGKYLPQPTNRE